MRPMEGAEISTSASMTKASVKSSSLADRLLVSGGRRSPLPGGLAPNMTKAYNTRAGPAGIRLAGTAARRQSGAPSRRRRAPPQLLWGAQGLQGILGAQGLAAAAGSIA